MDTRSPVGPAELVLMSSVARRHYLDGRSKTEIADEFGISRFKVARLLENGLAQGLVRIEIGWPGLIDVGLSDRLQERFGLMHAIVVDSQDDHPAAMRATLGGAAADLLQEIVTTTDVLGLAWARSVSAMTGCLTRLPATPVVQLTGALSRPDIDDSSMELVRGVAQLSGGPAYLYYAPLVVADAATARALRGQPEVARAFAQFGSVTKAVAGLGGWAPGQSTVFDATEGPERDDLARQGVVADISGILLTIDGSTLHAPINDRMVGIDAMQMSAIPEVIVICYGPEKATAVLAGIRSGLVKGLVTHSALARTLLEAG